MLAGGIGVRGEPGGSDNEQALSAGVLKGICEPRLVAQAVDDQDRTLRDLDGVLRRRLKLMGINAGCQEGIHLEPIARHIPGDIAEEGLGGKETEAARLRGAACCGRATHEEQRNYHSKHEQVPQHWLPPSGWLPDSWRTGRIAATNGHGCGSRCELKWSQ